MPLSINTDGTAATIVSEEIAYKRYIIVRDRTTQFEDGRVIKWDVVGHNTPYPSFSSVFVYYSKTKTACILKEYSQGTNEIKYTCVAGAYDRHKHTSILDSAQHELSEEAHLKGGQWIDLSPKEQPLGISEMKWGTNRFVPFLCIDPIVDEQPLERDAEEYMEVVKDVSIADIKRFVTQGQVMLPSVQTIWMALEYLTENSLL